MISRSNETFFNMYFCLDLFLFLSFLTQVEFIGQNAVNSYRVKINQGDQGKTYDDWGREQQQCSILCLLNFLSAPACLDASQDAKKTKQNKNPLLLNHQHKIQNFRSKCFLFWTFQHKSMQDFFFSSFLGTGRTFLRVGRA